MPRKEFESFTRLDSSDINTLLMDQVVQTFVGTVARDSAITEPVQGMVTYLNDIDSLSIYNGTEFVDNKPIQIFAGTAARGSAISSPEPGIVTYLADSKSFEYWNGTSFVAL